MVDDKNLLSISQFAKLRGVTTETLRHYDRIGLLSPFYIDPETGYRYYSVLQYEQLGTIKELRSLDFSLDEIKDFFEQRSVEHSLEILKTHRDKVHEELVKLKAEEEAMDQKIRFIRSLPPHSKNMQPKIKREPERYYITNDVITDSEEGLGYSYSALESKLISEVSPILASDRMGVIPEFNEDDMSVCNRWTAFIFLKNKTKKCRTFAGGTYASIFSNTWPHIKKPFEVLKEYVKRNNYRITGRPLIFFVIDITIAAANEFTFCIQVPVSKN